MPAPQIKKQSDRVRSKLVDKNKSVFPSLSFFPTCLPDSFPSYLSPMFPVLQKRAKPKHTNEIQN